MHLKYFLILLGIILFSSCGFQGRKYTRGYYFDQVKNLHEANCTSSFSDNEDGAFTVNGGTTQLFSESDHVSDSITDIEQDFIGMDKNDPVNPISKIAADTTIKGNDNESLDLPNQKEAPIPLKELYNEAKRPVFRNLGLMTLITLLIMTCVGVLENGSYSSSNALAEAILGGGVFVLLLCVFPIFFLYRRKWKMPLKKFSQGLKDYRKFNYKERWYQSLQEDKGILELTIIASLGLISLGSLLALAILSSI